MQAKATEAGVVPVVRVSIAAVVRASEQIPREKFGVGSITPPEDS